MDLFDSPHNTPSWDAGLQARLVASLEASALDPYVVAQQLALSVAQVQELLGAPGLRSQFYSARIKWACGMRVLAWVQARSVPRAGPA